MQQGGFAHAIGAQYAIHTARVHLKVDLVEYRLVAPITERHSLNDNHKVVCFSELVYYTNNTLQV